MEQVGMLLQRHITMASGFALVLFVAGICLLFRRRSRGNTRLVAKSRGVVVGRDSSGPISTGDVGATPSAQASRDWIDITGAIVALLGVIVAALAWWFPRTP